MDTVYKGEKNCTVCDKKAYYIQTAEPRCGRHSDRQLRKSMPELPQVIKNQRYELIAEKALASQPRMLGMIKQHMVKPPAAPPGHEGYLVFPNEKAKVADENSARAKFQKAMSALSPKVLQPVDHRHPDLPNSPCILENFWQFSKVFPSELDERGEPKLEFFERRKTGFLDHVAHRHKFSSDKTVHMLLAGIPKGGNANISSYSLFWDPIEQKEQRFSYTEARKFYCSHYENLVRKTAEFVQLQLLLEAGSVYLCGFDAVDHPLTHLEQWSLETLEKWYHDEAAPFGHEKALLAILVYDAQEKVPPWRTAQPTLPTQ